MPSGLGHLHKLEILSKFIVGAEDGLMLKELQHLQNLHGELVISNLQNVRDVGDARDAKLKAKANLTYLALHWDAHDSENLSSEPEVLAFLQPHPNIKEVKIYGYGGICFPAWIGSPSLINVKRIRLGGCQNIRTLPSFGLLPSLIELEINWMNNVCTIGPEFFGSVARPFPSLEVLTFLGMQAWEYWSFSFGDKQIEEPFPRLIKLKLQECPKLAVGWLHRLHSLVQLKITNCPLLNTSSVSEKLKLGSCNREVVSGISSNVLEKISLTSIPELEYLNEDILRSFRMVETLKIKGCDGLRWLWQDDAEAVESLARLKSLSIENCANLEKLPHNMQRLIFLRELNIENCPKLEYVPEGMMSCSRLEKLSLQRCGSLKCFPKGATVPTSMKSLVISNCEKLENLLEGIVKSCSSKPTMHLAHLEDIVISQCPSLKPFIGMQMAPSSCLKTLRILDSTVVLDCLIEKINMFTSLSKLSLSGCLSLEVNEFPQLPSSVKSLSISRCTKIKSLPHRIHTSTSLLELMLHDLSIESFPEGGLPLSLELLRVEDCKNLRQPITEWGLQHLTALKHLEIKSEIGCLSGTCFPPPSSDWTVLPSNIEILMIDSQPNLVSLRDGLRGRLNSLQELKILSCPKLRFLPKEGFPPSLGALWVDESTEIYKGSGQKAGDTSLSSNEFRFC